MRPCGKVGSDRARSPAWLRFLMHRKPGAFSAKIRLLLRLAQLCSTAGVLLEPCGVPWRHVGHRLPPVVADEYLRDEDRFFSPYGIRSLSKWHEKNPFVFNAEGLEFRVAYEPAESRSGMFGGNSNWRGPIWFPVNLLIVRALVLLHEYFGESFQVECPT